MTKPAIFRFLRINKHHPEGGNSSHLRGVNFWFYLKTVYYFFKAVIITHAIKFLALQPFVAQYFAQRAIIRSFKIRFIFNDFANQYSIIFLPVWAAVE